MPLMILKAIHGMKGMREQPHGASLSRGGRNGRPTSWSHENHLNRPSSGRSSVLARPSFLGVIARSQLRNSDKQQFRLAGLRSWVCSN